MDRIVVIQSVYNILYVAHKVTISELSNEFQISFGSVQTILIIDLGTSSS